MRTANMAHSHNDAARATSPDLRLGVLMVRAGVLSYSQAEMVGKLVSQGGLRFGELAIQLNLARPEDVEAALTLQGGYAGLPVQQVPQRADIIAALDPEGRNIDKLRTIRGQLQLGWFNQQKILLLTGPAGGEGISTVAAGLACMFADLDRRTLLIDANLRAPSQHRLFGLSNQSGLSNILAGNNADTPPHYQRLLHAAPLSVLVAGPMSSNPAELISRESFKQVLATGTAQYDVVLIDGPCGAAPEFQVMAAHAGGVMIVVQNGVTRLKAVRDLKSFTERAKAQIVGAILNGR